MSTKLDEAKLERLQMHEQEQLGFQSQNDQPRRKEVIQQPSQRQIIENPIQMEQIILYDGPAHTIPLNSNPPTSNFAITPCTIIGILTTIILASAFYLFVGPYIPAIRDRMILSAEGTQGMKSVSDYTPPLNTQNTPKSVSLAEQCILPSYAKWNYFAEPNWFNQFKYDTLEEIVIPFGHIISNNTKATQMILTIFIRSINENPWKDVWTRIRMLNGDHEFIRWIYTSVFPRDTIVVTQETIIVPIEKTREIRIKASSKRANWLEAGVIIQGYR